MGKVIYIEIPKEIPEEKIKKWIIDGMSRELTKELVLNILESGLPLDEVEELKSFEITRKNVWSKVKERYKRRGLL
jgi:hypothetical protein